MMNWRYQELVMGLLISWFVDDSLLINVDGDSCAQDAADLRAMLEWAGWKLSTIPRPHLRCGDVDRRSAQRDSGEP